MNDELQKALAEFVKATLAGFQAGKDFVVAEAPEVIQQLIRWKFWEAIAWCVVFGLMALAMAYVVRRLLPTALAAWNDDLDPMPIVGLCGSLIAMGATGANAVEHGLVALQIYIAPKVWLIEWAMRQVKS